MKLLNKIWPWSRFAALKQEAAEWQAKSEEWRDKFGFERQKRLSDTNALSNDNLWLVCTERSMGLQLSELRVKLELAEHALENSRLLASKVSLKGWSTRRAKALMAAKNIPFQPLRPRDEVVAGVVANRKLNKGN